MFAEAAKRVYRLAELTGRRPGDVLDALIRWHESETAAMAAVMETWDRDTAARKAWERSAR